MKLEFLNDINEGGQFSGIVTNQLIRLFDFDKVQADKFKQAIQLTIIDKGQSLALTDMMFIENLNCSLTLRIANNDIGITTKDNIHFYCDLTPASYNHMIDLLAPFCAKDKKGYQWLYDIDTPIEFLFSPAVKW